MSILTTLPPELINIILLQLTIDDIINLSECITLVISSEVYQRAFHDHTRLPHYTLSVFRQRAHCSLYMFGRNEIAIGRECHETPLFQSTDDSILVPRKVPFPGAIVEVGLAEAKAQILEENGCAYVASAVSAPQILDTYCNMRNDYDRRRSGTPPNQTPKCVVAVSKRLYKNPMRSPRMAVTSSGPFLNGIDRSRMFWRWDSGYCSPTGPLCLVQDGELIKDNIVEMKSHTRGLVCKLAGRGIVMSTRNYESFETPSNGMRGGYSCFDDHLYYCTMDSVPHTRNAGDFIVFEGRLVYLDSVGRLRETSLLDPNPAFSRENPALSAKIEELNSLGPFCQLVGSSKRLGLVTCDGTVVVFPSVVFPTLVFPSGVIGQDQGVSFQVIKDFCDVGVASIAVTLSYCLLLTKIGDVYSWGQQVHSCGCLGLGTTSEILKLPSASQNRTGVMVGSPTKVDLPGKAFAVIADRDTSAVLVDDG